MKHNIPMKGKDLVICPYCGHKDKISFIVCPRCGRNLYDDMAYKNIEMER